MTKVTRLTLNNSGELDRRRLNFREISGDADAPLESVGQDLRKARERKGEELSHIARVLKIRQDYLAAIEESAMEALPGRAYAIGFVRSYATYLGLDGEDYVERLKSEVAGRNDSKEAPVTVSLPVDRMLPQGIWLIGGLLAVALLYAAYYLLVSAPRISEQPVIPVPERLAAEAGLPPAAPAPAPPQQQAAASAPAPAPAVAPARPSPTQGVQLPQGRRYGVQNAGSRITLRIHRASHVIVRGANSRLFINRPLAPGDTYLVPNVVGLMLSTPDSGAIELILDGSSIGFAGANGVAASQISLNPQDLVDRRNRG